MRGALNRGQNKKDIKTFQRMYATEDHGRLSFGSRADLV